MEEITIPILWEDFEEMLLERRDFWDDGQHRTIPDCVWDYVMEVLRETGGLGKPEYNNPSYIVDNLVVNGAWQSFDDYSDLPDDEIQEVLEERGDYIAVFPEERLILWHTGL